MQSSWLVDFLRRPRALRPWLEIRMPDYSLSEAEAQTLADKVKSEGYQQADSLVARSGDGLAKIAATAAADKIRKESDSKSLKIVQEADTRANALVAEARKKAGP